jgi:uncharacterized membrane protein YccC
MGSLLEELARREAATRERVEAIREQIERLRERLAAEEEELSRLAITRATVEEILGEAARPVEQPPADTAGADGAETVASPIGVMTVPRRRPGMDTSVLPRAYQDVLEVLADAGRAMRSGQILAAVGVPAQAAKVEGLRSKLKRMVARGWLREDAPGLFTVAEDVAEQLAR